MEAITAEFDAAEVDPWRSEPLLPSLAPWPMQTSRWRQRFDNFERALQVLERGVIERYAPLFAALRERFRALGQEVS